MENIGLKGRFHIVKHTMLGDEEIWSDNTVVNDGKATIANFILKDVAIGSRFDHLAIGLGSTTPAATQTALVSEVYTRVDGTGTLAGSTATLSGQFDISGAVSISEYAVFNLVAAGSMLCRASGTAISAVSGDSIGIEYGIIAG